MKLRHLLPIFALPLLAACGHGATACAVVDAANQACTVIKYMDADGNVREVRVTRDELTGLARDTQARRVAEAKK